MHCGQMTVCRPAFRAPVVSLEAVCSDTTMTRKVACHHQPHFTHESDLSYGFPLPSDRALAWAFPTIADRLPRRADAIAMAETPQSSATSLLSLPKGLDVPSK